MHLFAILPALSSEKSWIFSVLSDNPVSFVLQNGDMDYAQFTACCCTISQIMLSAIKVNGIVRNGILCF